MCQVVSKVSVIEVDTVRAQKVEVWEMLSSVALAISGQGDALGKNMPCEVLKPGLSVPEAMAAERRGHHNERQARVGRFVLWAEM